MITKRQVLEKRYNFSPKPQIKISIAAASACFYSSFKFSIPHGNELTSNEHSAR